MVKQDTIDPVISHVIQYHLLIIDKQPKKLMGNDIARLCNSNNSQHQGFSTSISLHTQMIPKIIKRTSIVEQVYQKLIKQKQLDYSIQSNKTQYQPSIMNVFQEDCVYIGLLKSSLPDGPAQIYFNNNNYLEAIFIQGFIDCRDAIFIEGNGNYYRGGFVCSKQTGQGVLCSNGQLIRGHFMDGRAQGNGEKYFIDGRIYIGKFKNGKMEGKGKMLWKNQTSYSGYFSNDLPNGIGQFKNQFYEYHGPFKQGLKDGKGTIIFKDGNKFQGWFQGDFINGYGQWHRQNGKVEKGIYEKIMLPK